MISPSYHWLNYYTFTYVVGGIGYFFKNSFWFVDNLLPLAPFTIIVHLLSLFFVLSLCALIVYLALWWSFALAFTLLYSLLVAFTIVPLSWFHAYNVLFIISWHSLKIFDCCTCSALSVVSWHSLQIFNTYVHCTSSLTPALVMFHSLFHDTFDKSSSSSFICSNIFFL